MRYHARLLVALCLITATNAPGVETEILELRNGSINDGAVSLTRDGDGNLIFDDAFNAPVTLTTIRETTTDHGALTGLSDDDHPQYLNTARHDAAHSAPYNNALAISGDVNGNGTVGDHVADTAIHLNRTVAEEVTGSWNFSGGFEALSGGASLGESAYGSIPALGFADGSDRAEIAFDAAQERFLLNRDVGAGTIHLSSTLDGRVASTRTGAIEGFATIEGIAATDLLSSTAQESVSEEWTFLDGLRTNRVTITGYPLVVYTAKNLGAGAITAGTAVKWAGVDSGMIGVETLSSTVSSSTPFAGMAITGGAVGATIDVARSGVVVAPATGTFAVGDEVTWDGSEIAAGTERIGFALESHTGTGSTTVMLSGRW